ncbi:MAG: hypothetical protein ABSH29_10930 [Acidimicrobiales bacterium]|jgi:hypothetical protein
MATPDDQEGLWFDEDPSPPRGRFRRRRTTWIVLACVACVATVSLPVGLALSSSGGPVLHPAPKQSAQTPQRKAQAQRTILSALSATTSSGSYNVSYEFDPATPPTATATTSGCTVIGNSSTGSGSGGTSEVCPATPNSFSATTVTGQGTIDTDPFAMVATSDVTALGMITIRDNGTDIWEFGGGDYGLEPGSNEAGPGSTLTGFAGSVEGTLGQRQGALAMGGLSSPTGYLDLDQSMITGADEIGTGTVDGTAVTIYQLNITAAQEANVPDTTAQEAEAIAAANAVLASQGYTGTTVQVSIDASGYIRQTRSVAHFTDGSTTASEATFSDFGCAGTVLMPGQSGATSPPAGCVSPDTGVAPPTSTATSTSSTSTTSSSIPADSGSTTTTTSTATSTTTTTSTG